MPREAAMCSCPNCRHRFAVPADECGDHPCPRCGYMPAGAPDLAGYSRSIREADSPDEAQGLLREAADYLDESDMDRLRAVAEEKFRPEETA